jgi:hypothetical protein
MILRMITQRKKESLMDRVPTGPNESLKILPKLDPRTQVVQPLSNPFD